MQLVLKPLLRRPLLPILVIIQVGLTFAIVCNVAFLLQKKLTPLMMTDGISDPSNLLVVSRLIAYGDSWGSARLREIQKTLRVLPSVDSVTSATTLPSTTDAYIVTDVVGEYAHTHAKTVVYAGTNLIQTLGLQLVAGRKFSLSENSTILSKSGGLDETGPVIITQSLSKKLFPDGHALGGVIRYRDFDGGSRTVVGVVKHIIGNSIYRGEFGVLSDVMLFPGMPNNWPRPVFAIRSHVSDLSSLKVSVKNVIQRDLGPNLYPGITPKVESYSHLMNEMFAGTKSAVLLLSTVALVVMIVAFIGIAGTTQCWVRRCTKQIGIYRAIGACRLDVLKAFQFENLIIVSVGVILGMTASYGANIFLMQYYAFPRLPWHYIPVDALLFLLWGQIASLFPGINATRISPMEATRTI